MRRLVTLGEILVEIMAAHRGQSFAAPGPLLGPFASGAPAIFIDQAARLGEACGIIGCVGDDDFGRMNTDRLRGDGVDVTAIAIDPWLPTGSAFVRYDHAGDRHFVFNVRDSASGATAITDAARVLLDGCTDLHVMGSSLFSHALITVAGEAVDIVKRQGGRVSFDPNIRPEILAGGGAMRDALVAMLRRCDLFLPSGAELTMLTEADTPDDAVAEILGMGVGAIVHKQGTGGASYYDAQHSLHQPAFTVTEIDPTGAGDCFGATFVVGRMQGSSVAQALRYAAASGAAAVGVQGPMEGAADYARLDQIIAAGTP